MIHLKIAKIPQPLVTFDHARLYTSSQRFGSFLNFDKDAYIYNYILYGYIDSLYTRKIDCTTALINGLCLKSK